MGHYSVGIHGKGEITLVDLLKKVRENPELKKAGAISCFIGIVRGDAIKGGEVKRLHIEAYEEEAVKSLRKIAEEILQQPGIIDVRIHHAVGELEVGEDIVYIIVAGDRRDQVFKALRDAVERMKKEAAIWKKEITTSEEYWVSELE